MSDSISIVWFKRDLRVRDHQPLRMATVQGTVLPIYVFEPSLWKSGELGRCHFEFICQSLKELDHELRKRGSRLCIHVGELPDMFSELRRRIDFCAIYSHEETGTLLTYERDRRVARWARDASVDWHEYAQNGVVRRLRNRNGWAAQWKRTMTSSLSADVEQMVLPTGVDWGGIPTYERLGLETTITESMQIGGESHAQATLQSFLHDRSLFYRSAMSSPGSAERQCSRLSPYLAWGNLSIKQVVHATAQRRTELQLEQSTTAKSHLASLRSFESRLSWHCHFMQKLESEPEIEVHNICRVYDGLRENEFNAERFTAWQEGRTGYPMIDACMRYLHRHRWINFRMRAMLMSFAAYHLWLHWREPALHLARNFLDFEPGIHFPQCQMQSGVTGINTIRIYSPAKQLYDQDPTGTFVRKYVPELADVPMSFLAEPHRMSFDEQSRYGCRIGVDYPAPIVDARIAVKDAKDRIYAIRKTASAQRAAMDVFIKHGSRKPNFRDPLPGKTQVPGKTPAASKRGRRKAKTNPHQGLLPGMEDL